MLFFLKHGYRVIAHDRRGHGRSTQTGGGHDMDHYADDLAALTARRAIVGQTAKVAMHHQYRQPTTEAETINADLLAFIKS